MKAYFHTLGCKVNQYETQALRALLTENGYETAEFEVGMADIGDAVLVINSCTVTGESDRKLRQLLRRCRRDNPRAVLVLTGCFPQAFPDAAARLPEPNILLGNADVVISFGEGITKRLDLAKADIGKDKMDARILFCDLK